MSLKRNITANYISQIYVTLIGIVMLPIYIKYMGAEAYGLVGFFTMLQALFAMLDLGLTPTIGRETARYHGGVMPAIEYRQLFRALSTIFAIIAIVGGGALFLLSDLVATRWLHVKALPLNEVKFSVQIMAISVAMRWMAGLYRGVVTGSECLVWLSSFSAVIASLRFVMVLPVMWYYGYTPLVFFVYQLVIASVELVGLGLKSRQLLPNSHHFTQAIGWSFKPVQPVLKFALTIAFTSAVWVMVTQTDKLVLSGILPLDAYGYFTLAVLVAGGIMAISGPISSAVMPRMARLHAEGDHVGLINVYHRATQLVTIIAGSAAITIACCAERLLFAWTGNAQLAVHAAPILQLYAIGNGFLVVAAFPYYLQYARGNLRYHLIGNAGMVVVLIPSIIFAAKYYGGVGAGYVWLTTNVLYLLIWVAYVHHKLEVGLHVKWLRNDILKIILPTIVVAMLVTLNSESTSTRIGGFIHIVFVAILTLTISFLSAKTARETLFSKIRRVLG